MRPTSWEQVVYRRPATGARYRPGGLAAWQSVVPQRSSSRSGPSRGKGKSRRGQANDLERQIAEQALDNEGGNDWNLFNAGGRVVRGAFDIMDTPGAFVRSAMKEAADQAQIGGDDASFREFIQQGRDNITGQELLGLDDEYTGGSAAAAIGAGFAVDILTDPLTALGGSAARGARGGAEAARALLKPTSVRKLGEAAVSAAERAGASYADDVAREAAIESMGRTAANKAAQKTAQTRSTQVLSPIEREIIGDTPGTFVRVPGTRNTRLGEWVENKFPGRVATTRSQNKAIKLTNRELGAGRVAGRVRSAITQNKFADAVAERFVKYPEARRRLLYGTPEDAAIALHTVTKRNAGDLQELLQARKWTDDWSKIQRRMSDAGIDGATARYALGEAVDNPGEATSQFLAKAVAKGDDALLDDYRAFRDRIVEDGNSIDPEVPWLMTRENYTTRTPSDEMLAFTGGWGGGGHMRPVQKRMYGPDGEFKELFGVPLDPDDSRSIEQQIDDILAEKGYGSWFEEDIFKAMPDYIRRTASRYGDEYVAKQLRDLGIAESSMVRVLTDAGERQGRIKAFMYDKMLTSRVRADRAARNARRAQRDLPAAEAEVQRGKRLRKTARQGREAAEAEARDIQNMVDSLDSETLKGASAEMATDAATFDAERQALIDQVADADDAVFALEHEHVEASHRLAMEQYQSTKAVTKLEAEASETIEKLGDTFELIRGLSGRVDFRRARAHLDSVIEKAEARANKIIANEARYGPEAFDKAAADLSRLQALRDDNVAFRNWATRQNNLGQYKDDYSLIGDAVRIMKEAEDEAVRLMEQRASIEATLQEFEDLAQLPTEQLDVQMQQINDQLEPALLDWDGGRQTDALRRKIETLANAKAGIVHQKSLIERARGRVGEVDRSAPDLIAAMNRQRDVQSMADQIIHARFPELPAEVNGSRIRGYFEERHSELLEQLDTTYGSILGAYDDADTLRAELSGLAEELNAAKRRATTVRKNISPRQAELERQQQELLENSQAMYKRALEIEDEVADARQHIETNRVPSPGDSDESYAELMAEHYLATQQAKYDRYEARALELESKASNARKVANTWDTIVRNNLSKEQETAFELMLKDSYRALGQVSQTKHAWVVDMLKSATVMQSKGAWGTFLRGYDRVLNTWKAYALATPGTVQRNLFGATWNNYLADIGVRESDYRTVMRNMRSSSKLSPEDQAIMDQIRGAGLMEGGVTSLEVERSVGNVNKNPLSPNFVPLHAMRNLQGSVENLARGTLAYRTIKNGGTIDDAIDNVIKYHFNYDDLNKFERSALRRVIPFYTWTRKNLPLMLEQMVQNPKKFARFYQLRNEIEYQTPMESVVPAYFDDNMAIRLPFKMQGSQAYYFPDLPFTAVSDTMDPTLAVSSVTPFIKTPIEYVFGRQLFKGIPLRDEYQPVPGYLQAIPGSMQLFSAMGRARRGADGQWNMKQKDMYALESYFPVFGRARRLFPTEEKYDERVMSSWASVMFGQGLRLNSPTDRRNEAYRRVDSLLDRYETYEQLGYFDEDTKMPRPGQTINAAYESIGVER